MTKKTFQELTIKDDFMFGAVMSNESNCKVLLEMVLGFPIGRVVVDKQRSIIYHPEYKSIRMDVYAVGDDNKIYDCEMQCSSDPNIERRARYYHSQMDMELLEKGTDYEDLPDSYVIFICDYDPFCEGKYRYTFSSKCNETEKELNDGVCSVFLSTKGTNDNEVSKDLVQFLKYVTANLEDSTADFGSEYVEQLQKSVSTVKANRELGGTYMKLQVVLNQERKEGRAEGLAEGMSKGLAEGMSKGLAEGMSKGRAEGLSSSIISILESKGAVSASLKDRISGETDKTVLDKWLLLAANSVSVTDFEEQICR